MTNVCHLTNSIPLAYGSASELLESSCFGHIRLVVRIHRNLASSTAILASPESPGLPIKRPLSSATLGIFRLHLRRDPSLSETESRLTIGGHHMTEYKRSHLIRQFCANNLALSSTDKIFLRCEWNVHISLKLHFTGLSRAEIAWLGL